MDALQSCARKYAELCGYTYDCTIARKNARVSLTFSFSAYEFRHLAGLHRLKHPRLQTNSERLFKDILAGKITLVDLRKASNWEEESEKFLSRLNALAQLDVLMDEFLLIYGFSGEKLARQIPLKKVGDPDDIANAVLYLASDESRFMTGAELKLDGGISAM